MVTVSQQRCFKFSHLVFMPRATACRTTPPLQTGSYAHRTTTRKTVQCFAEIKCCIWHLRATLPNMPTFYNSRSSFFFLIIQTEHKTGKIIFNKSEKTKNDLLF